MTSITLHHGDNRAHLRRLIADGVRVHSVVTDPPYGLVSVTKRFGGDKAAPAKFGSDGAFQRASAGFMGSKWDGTGIERDVEFWRLVWEILLPGGYCVAFSGARTGHWQACAMEVAGFVMHPMIGWVFGQGFPKAHNAAKAIDKKLGHQGGVIPTGDAVRRMIPGAQQNATGDWTKTDDGEYQPGTYVPATEQARQWEGWAYGAQSMKPAMEPIYIGQKPFSEKDGVLNLLKHGVGAMNIDGCRVGWNGPPPEIGTPGWGGPQKKSTAVPGQDGETVDRRPPSPLGRHPANLIHDGSFDVMDLFPQTQSGKPGVMRKGRNDGACYGAESRAPGTQMSGFGDAGSAGRFFNAFPMSDQDYAELLCEGIIVDPDSNAIYYQAKATKTDRAGSKHPTVKPVALMRWLCRLVTPPGGTVLDPFAGSGTTAAAAREEGFDCVLMEGEDQFAADIRKRFDLESPHRIFPTQNDSPMRTQRERLGEHPSPVTPVAGDDFDELLGKCDKGMTDDFDELLLG